MKKSLILQTLLFCCTILSAQQIPDAISYQGIIRNTDGTVLAGQPVTMRFTITEITATGNQIYREKHTPTTNEFGLVTLQVGRGQVDFGTFSTIPWASNAKFLKVEVDPTGGNSFIELGSEELKSVPFAFAARTVTNPPALNTLPDVQTAGLATGNILKWDGNQWVPSSDLTGNTGYTAGPGIGIASNVISNTGDLSNTNEIQTLSLNGSSLSLSNGGGSVTLPSGSGTYTAGPGISINGGVISNTGDLTNTNEIQVLTANGTNLTLSNGGNTVTFDPSNTNEIQTLSTNGTNLTLSNGGNTVTFDPSNTNEIQTLSLNGSTLSLSSGGGSVTLPSGGGSSYWQSFGGNDIVNNNGGTVFVGPGTFESLYAQGSNNSSTFYSQNGGTGKAISAEANNGVAIELNGLVALRATGTGSSPAGTFNNFSGDGIALQVNGGLGIFGGFENYSGTISKADVISNFKFGGGLSPGSNNFYDLGSSDRRWRVLYAVNGTINTSDARQKQSIQPIGYGLTQVKAMKPVSFEWIDHPEQGRKLGFLAQDLQTVVPEVVSDTEWINDGKGNLTPKKAEALGVYYSDLIPVLVKAVQEQQAQIERLEQRIRDLEKK
ncbi:MAG TPA: tail fiber domain-containing protein [Saprospiraceae bacterium]|nr:tail fiber domain-containing protein [Saprospiraceae bacterium]HPI05901.1 tail fiber domain-containing protein [Saprospiraceae bacterium]